VASNSNKLTFSVNDCKKALVVVFASARPVFSVTAASWNMLAKEAKGVWAKAPIPNIN
jgi:hypothetical protein